jgi:hypothetical protein
MPTCKKHRINHSGICPECARVSGKRDGMQTPLWKIGNVHWQRTNGKPIEGENPLERPAVSRHPKQR